MGAKAFLKKPVEKDELLSNIKKIFSEEIDGKRALIIDDQEEARDLASRMLIAIGFEVDMANNGAEGLDKIMVNLDHTLDAAISLTANQDELVNRLVKRGYDSGRSDDTPEIIRNRQNIYWEQTSPILDFYRSKGLLKDVDGLGDIEEITDRILNVLK